MKGLGRGNNVFNTASMKPSRTDETFTVNGRSYTQTLPVRPKKLREKKKENNKEWQLFALHANAIISFISFLEILTAIFCFSKKL